MYSFSTAAACSLMVLHAPPVLLFPLDFSVFGSTASWIWSARCWYGFLVWFRLPLCSLLGHLYLLFWKIHLCTSGSGSVSTALFWIRSKIMHLRRPLTCSGVRMINDYFYCGRYQQNDGISFTISQRPRLWPSSRNLRQWNRTRIVFFSILRHLRERERERQISPPTAVQTVVPASDLVTWFEYLTTNI